jgi:N-acetylglucosaminyl-diphospho-decaprenol L-rhamnosyltransferase
MGSYSAVVLYYRAGPILGETLDALLAQSTPPVEVLVVDNASGDGVAGAVVGDRRGVRLLTLERNEGYAGGMNRGAAELAAGPSHLLFLTHESGLRPGASEALLAAAVQQGAAACGPLLERRRDGSVWSAGGTLSPRGLTGHLPAPRTTDGHAYEVEWIDGAAMLISRSAFDRIGGFDERFFLYWEDVDICVRLRAEGAILCAPSAEAVQETGETPPYYAARNRILFWRARGSRARTADAVRSEAWTALRSVVRRRPRPADAAGRLLGVVDGVAGALHPASARIRTRRP